MEDVKRDLRELSSGTFTFYDGRLYMELWSLWQVVRRRWLLVIVPAIVVAAVGLATYHTPPAVFTTSLRFTVGQPPIPLEQTNGYDRYYSWTSSEYIANGLADWVRGGVFAGQAQQALQARGVTVPAGAIQAAIVADKSRSMLMLTITWPDAGQLQQIVPAVVEVLQTKNADAFPQLGPKGAVITPMDPIEPVNVASVPPGLSARLGLALRLALAVTAGFGLAFLVEYLDPTVRDRRDAERLGLPVMGEIPGR